LHPEYELAVKKRSVEGKVLDLQKQLGEMGNRVDEATKAREDRMKQTWL